MQRAPVDDPVIDLRQTDGVEEETIRRRLVIRGRVQGVGFRVACRQEAEWHGVAGWIQNLADGSVEVIAEGGADVVPRLVDWCRNGPRHAQVTSVDITAEAPRGEIGFRIAR